LKRRFIIFLVLALAWLAACAQAPVEPKPPEIAYGQDLCDQCGMVIGEARFASALQLQDGKYLKFDDTGEMLAYMQANPDTPVLAWFVHDYPSEAWIRGEQAFYVLSAALETPMGTGIVAFKERSAAEAFAGEQSGQVLTFEEIQTAQPMMGGHK
jgi:copper chaperone NosL